MLVQKTLKLPVGDLTKAKSDVLNRLTARLTLAADRDEHGATNIALRALNQGFLRGAGAFVDMPELRMNELQKFVSAEAPHFSAG